MQKIHGPGKCEIKADTAKEQLRCTNCGQIGHPASYKACPYLKLAISIKKEQKRQKQPGIRSNLPINHCLSTTIFHSRKRQRDLHRSPAQRPNSSSGRHHNCIFRRCNKGMQPQDSAKASRLVDHYNSDHRGKYLSKTQTNNRAGWKILKRTLYQC